MFGQSSPKLICWVKLGRVFCHDFRGIVLGSGAHQLLREEGNRCGVLVRQDRAMRKYCYFFTTQCHMPAQGSENEDKALLLTSICGPARI
ncbi:hypothetical protein CHARACLAT_005600 [Characodon lateralis]|uniref:Uncharacterized protein n=1 Tax=Characodon lateralis TaxID=208331 RepID=A0ABU7E7B8_9TELE|nr:hypothetical protein [Characodon lateralis]